MSRNIENDHAEKRDIGRLIHIFNGPNCLAIIQRIPSDCQRNPKGITICRALTMSSLGLALDDDDGKEQLDRSAQPALGRDTSSPPPLTVPNCVCNGCKVCDLHVIGLCQNCTEKLSLVACRFETIRNDWG
jgi:hypothetical protein